MTRKNNSFLIVFFLLIVSHAIIAAQAGAASTNNNTTNSILAAHIGPNVEAENPSSLKPFSANYIALRSGKDVGNALLELTSLTDNRYELTYQSKVSRYFLTDKRFEKTKFANENGNLTPLNYDYKRTGTGPNKKLSVTFDSSLNTIHIDDDADIEWNGEFDNQLFRVDFPHKLSQGINAMEYNFINYRGEKRKYSLEVVDTENLALPYGSITALKVLIGRESSSRTTYAWFAPSLNFNLVRLQQFKDNKEQGDIQLNTFAYLE